jgi:hypothetical protein
MTTRGFRVFALISTTAIAMVAEALVADSVLSTTSAQAITQSKQSSIIIVAPSIHVKSASGTPLLIEVGPPERVPRDSTLYVSGLPDVINLSQGHRVSEVLWAVSTGDLPNLKIEVAPKALAWLAGSEITITLRAADGSVLATARTAISINAPTKAGADEADNASPPIGPNRRLPPTSPSSERNSSEEERPKASPPAPSDVTDGRNSAAPGVTGRDAGHVRRAIVRRKVAGECTQYAKELIRVWVFRIRQELFSTRSCTRACRPLESSESAQHSQH